MLVVVCMKTIVISLENDLCNNLCTVFETGNRLFTPSRISRHRVQTIRRFLTMASVTNNVEETYDHDRAAEKTVTVTISTGDGSLKGLSLSQFQKVFCTIGVVELCYRISDSAVGIIYRDKECCDEALLFTGISLTPVSSANLPPQEMKVTKGLITPDG